MEEISESGKLRNAIAVIEGCAESILTEDENRNAVQIQILTELMGIILPIIINDYERPEFAGRSEEIPIWVDLARQLTEILAGDDSFAKTDFLLMVLIPDIEEHIMRRDLQ